jgi:hypothetical protein
MEAGDVDTAVLSMAQSITNDGSQQYIQLPRLLRRRPFAEISSAALEAIDAELRNVPLEYIRDAMLLTGQEYAFVLVFFK